MNRRTAHPAEIYMLDVLSGKEPACEFVKQTCQRQIDDMADAGKSHFPFYHDRKEALRILAFKGFCRQSKGRKWAGQPLTLMSWQQFITWCVYGWMREEDDFRRFSLSYVEIPRKNGKSTNMSAEGLALFLADGEPGAEVYCAANKEKQAKIIWGESKRMAEQTPEFRGMIEIFSNNMNRPSEFSKYEPIGADSDTQDGLNPSGVIYDELHAAKSRELWDKLTTGGGSRDQSLVSVITTAGSRKTSICYEVRGEILAILKRAVRKEDWFGYISTIDEKDDWEDPKVWRKANPAMGTFLNERVIRSAYELAKQLPSELNKFLRFHLNVWVEGVTQMITEKLWAENDATINLEDLDGAPCFGALDLSSEKDLTALVYAFELEDGYVALVPRIFCPEERIEERSKRDGVPYDSWRREGHLIATPGDMVDYSAIEECLENDREKYDIKELAFDPKFATYLAVRLGPEGKGFNILRHYQYFSHMNPPTRLVQKLFMAKKIIHFGHPILRWCAMNTAIMENHQGELRPSKKDSTERIDAMVAAIMAVGRLFNHEDKEDHGVDYGGMVTV